MSIGDGLAVLYNDLSFASILFMAAAGLAIIFGLMGVINLAQGEFIMIGAYATYGVQEAFRRLAPPAWLDAYHARVLAEVGPTVSPTTAAWLARVCAPL